MVEEWCNPYTEIMMLTGHTDIIRIITIIDDRRCCTAGDDGVIIIWNIVRGCKEHTLSGHTRPVTGLSLIKSAAVTSQSDNFLWLVSASSDRLVNIWDVSSGILLKTFSDHGCAVKCLAVLRSAEKSFCSGSERLCLWNIDDGLLDSIASTTTDAINSLLVLTSEDDDVIVAASDRHIVLYRCRSAEEGRGRRLELWRCLSDHREAILSMSAINERTVASGSLDGTLLQWSLGGDSLMRKYNVIEGYEGPRRDFPYSVQSIVCIDERFLLCAVGSGFSVYDSLTGEQVLEQKEVHDSKVLSVQLVYHRRLLASCSVDGSIKLWGCLTPTTVLRSDLSMNSDLDVPLDLGQGVDEAANQRYRLSNIVTCLQASSNSADLALATSIRLVGDCTIHSGPVNCCMEAAGAGLISCGADGLVIIWKDRLVSDCKRDRFLRDALYGLGGTPARSERDIS